MVLEELRYDKDDLRGYRFFCPACNKKHSVFVKESYPGAATWSFNGDVNHPTFTPSVGVTGSGKGEPKRCHMKITDGFIHYYSDCTHSMAGAVVKMKEVA